MWIRNLCQMIWPVPDDSLPWLRSLWCQPRPWWSVTVQRVLPGCWSCSDVKILKFGKSFILEYKNAKLYLYLLPKEFNNVPIVLQVTWPTSGVIQLFLLDVKLVLMTSPDPKNGKLGKNFRHNLKFRNWLCLLLESSSMIPLLPSDLPPNVPEDV